MLYLIQLGHLPQHIAKVKPSSCLVLLLRKSRRRPRRSRDDTKHIRTPQPRPPSSSLSVDKLFSRTPGIKPQHTGKITSTPIVVAQLFADHSSSPTFVCCHLLKNFTLEKTIKAKVNFKSMSDTHDVTIRHYHGENERCTVDGFIKACRACSQTTDFCGINAYFQNVIVESSIGHVQSSTHTTHLDGIRNWTEMISLEMHALAMLEAARLANCNRFGADGRPPIEFF